MLDVYGPVKVGVGTMKVFSAHVTDLPSFGDPNFLRMRWLRRSYELASRSVGGCGHGRPLPRAPDFGCFLERDISHRYPVNQIRAHDAQINSTPTTS
jgi:hypothetical protein